jgi:hypothetical protein
LGLVQIVMRERFWGRFSQTIEISVRLIQDTAVK